MELRKIKFLRELCITQMNQWVLIAISLTLCGLLGLEDAHFGLWLLCGVLPVFFYLVRLEITNFFLFFAIHILTLGVPFLYAGTWIVKAVLFVNFLVYFMISIRIRIQKHEYGDTAWGNVFTVGVLTAATLLHDLYLKGSWRLYYNIGIFWFVICYFLYYFMEQYMWFLEVNKNSTDCIPQKAMFRSGIRQTGLYLAGSVGVMLLCIDVRWLQMLLSVIGKGIRALLRFLYSMLDLSEETVSEPIVEEMVPQISGDMGLGGGEAGLFWVILEKIAVVVVAIAIIAAVVAILVCVWRTLWNGFYRVRTGNTQKEVVENGDLREQCEIIGHHRSFGELLRFFDNRKKARRMYKKYILKRKTELIGTREAGELNFITAGVCCERLENDELLQIYEKARYTEERITAEDLKRML